MERKPAFHSANRRVRPDTSAGGYNGNRVRAVANAAPAEKRSRRDPVSSRDELANEPIVTPRHMRRMVRKQPAWTFFRRFPQNKKQKSRRFPLCTSPHLPRSPSAPNASPPVLPVPTQNRPSVFTSMLSRCPLLLSRKMVLAMSTA